MSYAQAVIMGLLQGVTELFPVSSLGHSVLLPTLLGWTNLVRAQSEPESFFLAFLVGLHVATALALVLFYRGEWVRIVRGFVSSIRAGRATTPDERLCWLLLAATVPAGVVGLVFEHSLRTLFARPLAAAIFTVVNGLILFAAERLRHGREDIQPDDLTETTERLSRLRYGDAGLIGVTQLFALFAGISRSGITMVGGLLRGLGHRDAARFSFLLATPIILAAGFYKIPDLLGPNGDGVRAQVAVGSVAAGVAAYLSVRFLDRYFRDRTLLPFAVYCIAGGLLVIAKLRFFP